MQHANRIASEKAGVSIGALLDSHVIGGLRIDGDVGGEKTWDEACGIFSRART
jgi:hypothetical protein